MKTRITLTAIVCAIIVTFLLETGGGQSSNHRAITSQLSWKSRATVVSPTFLTCSSSLIALNARALRSLGCTLTPSPAVASTTTSAPPPTTTTTVPPPPPTTTEPPAQQSSQGTGTDGVTDAERAAWERVAACETGGNWSMQGSSYSGGLGFANSTWDANGGDQFAPNAGEATEDQQILIAMKIQSNPPDQDGVCSSW